VVVDLSPVSVVDVTAMQRFEEFREELARHGVTLAVARARRQLMAGFERRWVEKKRGEVGLSSFPTMRAAVQGFEDATAGGRGCDGAALDPATDANHSGASNLIRD
jgi:MFS superfamily sulfate permease-like transporter